MLTLLEKQRKPIIHPLGEPTKFSYKNIKTVYLMGDIPVQVRTDLDQTQLDRMCDGYYTPDEVENFERTGKFK